MLQNAEINMSPLNFRALDHTLHQPQLLGTRMSFFRCGSEQHNVIGVDVAVTKGLRQMTFAGVAEAKD